jgi:tRNA-uridine 2-sulfurtransferase
MFSRDQPGHPLMNRKAVALISGGLDSALAIHLVKRQGIEVTALHFPSFFSPLNPDDEDSPVRTLARQLGVPLVLKAKGEDFLPIIRYPRHGHGKNMNPCIDCRIYTFRKAKEFMEEIGASFLVTGEVAGQRPMSQRRNAMRLIEKQAGCRGIVLRPLSARVMPPSVPEQEGVVDREQLLDVAGRGRKVQLRMAKELGLTGYSPPAGGCLLTDKGFSRRIRDLLDDKEDVNPVDLALLQTGRHIRLRPGLKVVVGRSEQENGRIEALGGSYPVFFSEDHPGPLVAVCGIPDGEEELLIGSIVRRYCKESRRGSRIGIRDSGRVDRIIEVADVAQDEWLSLHLV